MRVIAGSAKGTILRAPTSHEIRPMTDRVKESLFSHLGKRPFRARVLDLFAGSGSLACEALSRGASSAVLIESSRLAAEAARENLGRCGFGGRAEVVRANVKRFLERPRTSDRFDLVFVDPPYAMDDSKVAALLEALVPLLGPGAAVCLHREKARLGRRLPAGKAASEAPSPKEAPLLPWPEPYRVVFERSYGGAVVGVAEIAGEGSGG